MNPRHHKFLFIAVLLFIVAIVFGTRSPWESRGFQGQTSIAPNTLAGLTACGFAVAGGLSLIAAALVERLPHDTPPRDRDEPHP
jgi:hypothetical protein